MGYDKKTILNSESNFKVLKVLSESEKGSYPLEISRRIEKHPSSVSNIIKVLRDLEIIKRGKRNKSQYYEIDREGLYDYFKNFVRERIENNDSLGEKIKEHYLPNVFLEEYNKEIKKFIIVYLKTYLSRIEESTLINMLLYDLNSGLGEIKSKAREKDEELEDWFVNLSSGVLLATFKGLKGGSVIWKALKKAELSYKKS